jgi:solute carrier family 35 protein
MFTVMRRFSVLLTMYGELFILKVHKPFGVQVCIYLMIVGALIAAFDDLSFDWFGYVYITLNNIFTAANGIYTKDKLNNSVI